MNANRRALEKAVKDALRGRGAVILQDLAVELDRPYDTVYGVMRDMVAGGRLHVGKEPPTGRLGPRRLMVALTRADLPIDAHLQVEVERLRAAEAEREARQEAQRERARLMVDAYRDGLTLEEIGERHGITRERVRQLITSFDPTMHRLVKRRRSARARLLEFVNHGTLPVRRDCPTCGACFEGPPSQLFCSPVHRQAFFTLRFQVDDDRRQRQYEKVARWNLEHPEKCTEHQLRHARRVLDGTVGEAQGHRLGARYLQPGSLPYHWALKAGALGWPLFDRLHPDVQAQVRDALGPPTMATEDVPAKKTESLQ